ncbi:hypothetical protein N7532_010803 [Penicillium argentinense]|uniref:Uncharacterized protein n=1 Tax=Penicillium argentinense TaxID=1131581 RepID=A0A9W9EQA1_9EURO|nr:uncharacterized protein N7532_010803 [Penicillium argentinense]KAJ5086032.1 hypothetical protein N7532_010803 [Penicillium argentinense]
MRPVQLTTSDGHRDSIPKTREIRRDTDPIVEKNGERETDYRSTITPDWNGDLVAPLFARSWPEQQKVSEDHLVLRGALGAKRDHSSIGAGPGAIRTARRPGAIANCAKVDHGRSWTPAGAQEGVLAGVRSIEAAKPSYRATLHATTARWKLGQYDLLSNCCLNW